VVVHKFLITKPQYFGSNVFIIFCDFSKNFIFSLYLYKQKALFKILYCWSFQNQLFPIDFAFYSASKNYCFKICAFLNFNNLWSNFSLRSWDNDPELMIRLLSKVVCFSAIAWKQVLDVC